MQGLLIVALSVTCCVTYGIIHDQITARICVEYFTIGHPPVFHTQDPTLLALGWGVIATWWVGVMLGVPLALVSRLGAAPKTSAADLVRPLLALMLACGLFAASMGLAGYIAAQNGVVFLIGHLASAVPKEKQVFFLADLWAHNASYFAGFLGGLYVMIQVWRSRQARITPS